MDNSAKPACSIWRLGYCAAASVLLYWVPLFYLDRVDPNGVIDGGLGFGFFGAILATVISTIEVYKMFRHRAYPGSKISIMALILYAAAVSPCVFALLTILDLLVWWLVK